MKRKLNKHVFLIGGMLFFTFFAFLIIDLFSRNTRDLEDVLVSEKNLKQEIAQLDSRLMESQDVIILKDDQLDMVETLLEQKYLEINDMVQKADELTSAIRQLKRQGETDRQTIMEMEEQLADISGRLLLEYKNQIGVLVMDLSSLNRREDSLVQANQKNSSLLSQVQRQYQDCINGKVSEQLPILKETPKVPEMEFDFQASNIRVLSFDKSGSIPRHNLINTKGATRLDIKFEFVGIDVVAKHLAKGKNLKGDHKLFAVLQPINQGKAIVNPAQSKSGEKFMYQGEELISSFPIKVNYQGESQQVKSEYLVGKSFKNIKKGRYKLEIYWQSQTGKVEKIGSEEIFFQ